MGPTFVDVPYTDVCVRRGGQVTGEVFTWGNGDHGKLGLGDAAKVSTPRAVESLRGLKVLNVASYNEHSAALVEARPEGLTAAGSPSLAASYFDHMGALLDRPDFSDVCFLVGVHGRSFPLPRPALCLGSFVLAPQTCAMPCYTSWATAVRVVRAARAVRAVRCTRLDLWHTLVCVVI